MNDIIEIYDEYRRFGIKTRKITEGLEFDLVRSFIDYRKEKFRTTSQNKLAIFIEPKINNSYPDIVFVNYNPENYNYWNEKRKDLSTIDYKILYHIFISKQINAKEINLQLGIPWKDIMLSIERLYDSKLISRRNSNWEIKDKNIFSVNNIEAVEAKINKLDEVFKQALINKNFASESYILSNMDSRIDSEKINRFGRFGIGIYTSNNESFKKVNECIRSNIPVSFSSIYFNEWLGKILIGDKGVC